MTQSSAPDEMIICPECNGTGEYDTEAEEGIEGIVGCKSCACTGIMTQEQYDYWKSAVRAFHLWVAEQYS